MLFRPFTGNLRFNLHRHGLQIFFAGNTHRTLSLQLNEFSDRQVTEPVGSHINSQLRPGDCKAPCTYEVSLYSSLERKHYVLRESGTPRLASENISEVFLLCKLDTYTSLTPPIPRRESG